MIVQFFNRGTGHGKSPINYLLGRNRDRAGAELLRGNPDETIAIIDGSDYAKKYTSGCLSFEEADIPIAQKIALMDSFEECLFSGLDKNQYHCCWVQHLDKGRLELNFVIPNVELLSGKRLQPYFHLADKPRVDAWRTIQNIQYGFSDPDDPEKRQGFTHAKDLPKNSKVIQQKIHEGFERLILAGRVRNRDDVVQTLHESGFEITRITERSISLKNPEEGGRNIRLKGAFYEQDFRFSAEIQREIQERISAYRATVQERFEQAKSKYQRGIATKRAENIRRHSRPTLAYEKNDIQTLSLVLERILYSHSDFERNEPVFRQESRRAMAEVSSNQAQIRTDEQANAKNEFTASMQPNGYSELQRSRRQEHSLRSHQPERTDEMGRTEPIPSRIIETITEHSSSLESHHYERNRNPIIERVRAIRERIQAGKRAMVERIGEFIKSHKALRARKLRISRTLGLYQIYARTIHHRIEQCQRNTENAKQNLDVVAKNLGSFKRKQTYSVKHHESEQDWDFSSW